MIMDNANKSNLSLVEVSEVIAAVNKLNELSEKMHTKSIGLKEDDIVHIDIIIEALHDMDVHKSNAKDILEAETIKCAAVRHRLMHYPDEINREIHEAVQSARIVNEEAIDKIKDQLEQLSCEVENWERQTAVLDSEADNMRPELAIAKAEFDAKFAKMNDLLAEKATLQIRLNEDRESVRRANVRMVELEEDTVRLAEQIAAEKEAHRDTMRQLQEETKVTLQQLNVSSEKESKVNREYMTVYLAQEQLTGILEEATKLHQNLEHEIAMLQVQEQDTRRQHAQQRKCNDQLRSNIEVLTVQAKSAADEHQAHMTQMTMAAKELDSKIQRQAALKEQVAVQKSDVKARTEVVQVKEVNAKKIEDTKQSLQTAQQDLTVRFEDLGRLRQEIGDMEGRRNELEDAQRAEKEGWLNPSELLESNTVLGFNREIAELKDRIEKERSERMTVQAACEKLQASVKEFQASEVAQTNEINAQIDSLKHDKIALDEEQRRLVAAIKTEEARRASLDAQLASGRQLLAEVRDAKEAEAERLLADTGRLRQEASARAAELAELAPKFEEFRGFFERSTGDYDALKRSLAAMKRRKAGLEESSRRAGDEIQRLAGEIDGLRRDRERRVAQSGSQMDQMAGDRVRVESDIYALGCKLRTVTVENARLEAGIASFENAMRSMRDTWEQAVPAKARIEQLRAREAERFRAARLADLATEAEFQAGDRRLLVALAGIVADTEARRVIVEAVADGMDAELAYLDDFLRTSDERG